MRTERAETPVASTMTALNERVTVPIHDPSISPKISEKKYFAIKDPSRGAAESLLSVIPS